MTYNPAPAGGSATISTVTIDFGAWPVRVKQFTIAAPGVTPTSRIIVGLGVLAGWPASAVDEWEMDPAFLTTVPGTDSFLLNVAVQTPVGIIGTRQINFLVG